MNRALATVAVLSLLIVSTGCGGCGGVPKPEAGLPVDSPPTTVAGLPAVDGGGGRTGERSAVKPETPHYYKRVVVVGIGVESYKHVKDKAQFAEKDVSAALELFGTVYGYETVSLLGKEATRAAIRGALEKVKKDLGKDDALIVYFSGHGQVIDLPSHGTAGYLVPYDADLDLDVSKSPADWAEQGLDMRELTREFEGGDIRHVLFVVDACCSGFMTRRGDFAFRSDLQELMTRRSRTVLAASTDRRPAIPNNETGHGFFTGPLLDKLRSGEAASVTEVFLAARKDTVKNSKRIMLPQRGEFGVESGEFVFIPRAIKPGEVAAAVKAAHDAELKRSARRTLPEHLYDISDSPGYTSSPKRADIEAVWKDRLKRFQDNATLGDPLAMAGASLCLGRGLGVEPTEASAAESYDYAKKANATGLPVGKYALAVCLLNGVGVKKNPLAARELLEQALSEKFTLAALPLADLLTVGELTTDASKQATDVLERAERDGILGAVVRSGQLALRKDPAMAAGNIAKWVERLRPAVEAKAAGAQFLTYEFLTVDPKRLTDKERDQAYVCLVQAAEAGLTDAQFRLAAELYQKEWYTSRLGRKQDFAGARGWAEAASGQGHYEATKMMAMIHVLGDGVPKNLDTATGYYRRTRADGRLELDWVDWFLEHAPAASKPDK